MSYLLANGCSFTDQAYDDNDGCYHTREEKIKLGFPEGGWPMWPEYVGEKIGLPVVNLGKSGGSNHRMHETTLAQVHKNKPAAIMHLWTSNARYDLLGHNLNEYTFLTALRIANCIIKQQKVKLLEELSTHPHSLFALAWQAIRIWQPKEFNKCWEFYDDVCDNSTLPKLQKLNDRTIWWPEDKALQWFGKYWSHNYNINENIQKKIANQWIDRELQPLLNTYHMCKSMDIPLIASSCYSFGGGFYCSDANVGSKLNELEKMIISAMDISDAINKYWISNSTFKALDDLIFEGDYIMPTWPNHSTYQKDAQINQWLDGWKDLSYKDQHPHWDTQKLMGDVFYDLYKKNYS